MTNQNDKITLKRWYVLAGVGFYPLIGLPFSFACLLRGFQTRRTDSFLFRVALYSLIPTALVGVLFFTTRHFGFKGKMDSMLKEQLVSDAVVDIEIHKIQTGKYPDSLWQVNRNRNILFILDGKELQDGYFYETKGSGYILGEAGKDGIRNSKDDIHPKLSDTTNFGIKNAVLIP